MSETPKAKLILEPIEVTIGEGEAARTIMRTGVFFCEAGKERIYIGRVWRNDNARSRWRWSAVWTNRGIGGMTYGTAIDKEEAAWRCYAAWKDQTA